MGCCFDSKEVGTQEESDYRKHSITMVSSKLSSGAERLRTKNNSRSQREQPPKDGPVPGLGPNIAAQTFTFRELAAATKNFRPESLLGEGRFGHVYKGRLESTGELLSIGQPESAEIQGFVETLSKMALESLFKRSPCRLVILESTIDADRGLVVAVKQLDRNGLQGNREFLVEVLMLSLLHHPNLVNLIGYCADGDWWLLVYEFMCLGSLEDHLHDLPPEKEPLDWTTRMKIAAGAAKGLEYLHDKANPPVIYRDFKSSNILLEEGFQPKLSDFGLAKLGPTGDKSHVSIRVMRTYGYCDPEYAMTGQLSVKSDVYSFGVVFLELITGRKAIDSTQPHGEQNLVAWARPLFNDRRKFSKLADPQLKGRYPVRGLFQALAVASMCIQEKAAGRPLIGDVVTALSYLANQAYEPNAAGLGYRSLEDNDDKRSRDERGGQLLKNEEGGGSGRRWDLDGSEKEESPRETARTINRDLERDRAVVEAKMWGENWREKRRQSAQGSDNGSNT